MRSSSQCEVNDEPVRASSTLGMDNKLAKNVRLRLRNVASSQWNTSGGAIRRGTNRIAIIRDRD